MSGNKEENEFREKDNMTISPALIETKLFCTILWNHIIRVANSQD